jgi:hypothetical protein
MKPAGGPLRFWDYARKAGVGLLGLLAAALSMGLLPDPWDKVVTAVLALATYFGIYVTSNVNPLTKQELPAGSDPNVRPAR